MAQVPSKKFKRRTSAKTRARLKAMRRKYGLGEFQKKGKSKRQPVAKKTTRARPGDSATSGTHRATGLEHYGAFDYLSV